MKQRLFTESRGYGSDLVLIHGWGLNSGVWEPVSHLLQDHFRLTLVDLPGFGRNAQFMPENYTLDELVEFLRPVIPQGATILGWSMGGLIAQHFALKYPEDISRLILVASTPKFVLDESWPGIKPEVLNVFEQQLERDFSKTLDRFLAIQALGSPSSKMDIKTIRRHVQHFPIPDDHALRAGLKLLSDVDLRTSVSESIIPTLRLYGRLDSLVPHKVIEKVTNLDKSSESYLFAHASHAPFISHMEEFVDVIKGFLKPEGSGFIHNQ